MKPKPKPKPTPRPSRVANPTPVRAGACAGKVQRASSEAGAKRPASARTRSKPARLLAGGNPRISKADGDAPVQAYIVAMPGWKRDVGRKLDELITRTIPVAKKAVKWNSPFYGIEGQGWFMSFHTFTRYVKVAFFNGVSLRPVPPGPSKSDATRYLDVHEHDVLDETQFTDWVRQAAALPGWGA